MAISIMYVWYLCFWWGWCQTKKRRGREGGGWVDESVNAPASHAQGLHQDFAISPTLHFLPPMELCGYK